VTLIFHLESGVRVMCDVGYLPRPFCSRLRPDVGDRRQTASSLNAPFWGEGITNEEHISLQFWMLGVILIFDLENHFQHVFDLKSFEKQVILILNLSKMILPNTACKNNFVVLREKSAAATGVCLAGRLGGSVKVLKVKVHTLDIAPLRSESPPQKRSGMARVLRDFTVLPAHPHVHPQSE